MQFLNTLNTTIFNTLKTAALIVFLTNFNIANATSVIVKVEEMGLSNWSIAEQLAPGFGSSGPVDLDWDPNNNFFTELLVWNNGYSGQGAVFCWHGEDCALEISTSVEDTSITLESFTIGYYGYGGVVGYDVIDLETNTSLLSDKPWISREEVSLINVNLSSDVGFRILFGYDGFNGGINNIAYSYLPIPTQMPINTPIPTTVWLFASGLLGLMNLARRQQRNI